MKKIAIIGHGAIAQYVFNSLKKDKIDINSVICKQGRGSAAQSSLKKDIEVLESLKEFEVLPELILDCAGHEALKLYAVEDVHP